MLVPASPTNLDRADKVYNQKRKYRGGTRSLVSEDGHAAVFIDVRGQRPRTRLILVSLDFPGRLSETLYGVVQCSYTC